MRKSIAFGALHLVIAVTVGYAISGSFVLAGAIALVEPLVNTVAHYFFDRWWNRRESAAQTAAVEAPHPTRSDAQRSKPEAQPLKQDARRLDLAGAAVPA